MHLIAWVLGCASKFTALGAIVSRRWYRALPCFSAYLLAISLAAISNAFWQLLMKDATTAARWYDVIGVAVSITRFAAYVEAFHWFSTSLPRFRMIGWTLFGAITLLGALATVPIEASVSITSTAHALVGALGRWSGGCVAVSCLAALAAFRVIGGIGTSARCHASILALWSVTATAGWYMMGNKMGMPGAWTMIAGEIACPVLWVWCVREMPSWVPPVAVPGKITSRQIREEFKAATSGR